METRKEKRLLLQVTITPEADELLRSHARRKGDLGDIVDALIKEKYAQKT